MKLQNNLKIGTRLTLGFGALVALLLVLAAFALLHIGAISDAMRAQETVQQPPATVQAVSPPAAQQEADSPNDVVIVTGTSPS